MDEAFKNTLISNGYRITRPRLEVYELIKKHDRPMSIAELCKLSDGIDRTSVYRVLQLFRELTIVVSVPFGWKQKYELADPFAPHHHHMYCESCGAIKAVDSEKIEQLVEQLARSEGFTPESHHFEIKGKCQACA